MPPGIVVAFVQVQHRMDVQLVVARPPHQFVDDVERLARTVDVVDQVADAVDDDQSDVLLLVQRPADDVPALVGRVLAQHEELDPVVLPVCRQPRQLEYPVQYLVAVAFALFRVNVQHAVLAGRQLRLVFQHLFPRQGRGHDGADIERFLAFGLSGRCAEIAQRRHGHAVYLHDLLRKVVLFGDIQTNVLQ